MSENVDADGEADDSRREDVAQSPAADHRQPPNYGQVSIANMMQITPDDEGNGSRPMGEASLQTPYTAPPPTSSLNWNTSGLALPQGRVYYPPDPSPVTREPLPNNASTVVDTPSTTNRSQRVRKPTEKAQHQVPTPVQTRIVSPSRERHESPLERRNPRRHENQNRNPLVFEASPPNPYSQPTTQSQHPSDPYRQAPSYGQGQGTYPQLWDTTSQRIAYDPNEYRNNAPSTTYNQQQQPRTAARGSASKAAWANHGQDAAAAGTLQRIHGYGSSGSPSSRMTPVPLPNQARDPRDSTDGMPGMMGASNQGASRKPLSTRPGQQQAPPAGNRPLSTQQQPWHGFGGLHGGANQNTHSNHGWGGSGSSSWN